MARLSKLHRKFKVGASGYLSEQMIDKILRDSAPGELPIELPTKFETFVASHLFANEALPRIDMRALAGAAGVEPATLSFEG